jgi:hypothetical protein
MLVSAGEAAGIRVPAGGTLPAEGALIWTAYGRLFKVQPRHDPASDDQQRHQWQMGRPRPDEVAPGMTMAVGPVAVQQLSQAWPFRWQWGSTSRPHPTSWGSVQVSPGPSCVGGSTKGVGVKRL